MPSPWQSHPTPSRCSRRVRAAVVVDVASHGDVEADRLASDLGAGRALGRRRAHRGRRFETIFSPREDLTALELYVNLITRAKQSVFMTAPFGVSLQFEPAFQAIPDKPRYVLLDKPGNDMRFERPSPNNHFAAGAYLGTAQDGLQNIADAMCGAVELATFAEPSMDIETVNNLGLWRLSGDQQTPLETILASPCTGGDQQPRKVIEGRPIGLAFGDTLASVRDVGALGPASSDHLLLSHITYALTALHCKEALITGSLIGMSGSRWSDAMDGFNPGLARWRAVFEGPAAICHCESTTCAPGAGCLGHR
jgi:hypothetical protein